MSVARATNRKFVRMSWAVCATRRRSAATARTYIGSMPGKIIQNLANAACAIRCSCSMKSTRCPPISAATSSPLEVLIRADSTFNDHYLEGISTCPSHVRMHRDSLNIRRRCSTHGSHRLPGYTEDEKSNIARRYLLPQTVKQNGLKPDELVVETRPFTT